MTDCSSTRFGSVTVPPEGPPLVRDRSPLLASPRPTAGTEVGSREVRLWDPRFASWRSFQRPSAASRRMSGRSAPEYRSRSAADAFPQLNGSRRRPRQRGLPGPAPSLSKPRGSCRRRAGPVHRFAATSPLGGTPTAAAFRYEVVHLAAVHLASVLAVPVGRHFLGPYSSKFVGHFFLIDGAHRRERLPRQGPCLTRSRQPPCHPENISGRPFECQRRRPVEAPGFDPRRPRTVSADRREP
jgi:hypothetical protein